MTVRTDHLSVESKHEILLVEQEFEKNSGVKKWKTFLALVFLFMAWLCNDVALAWIHERVPYGSDPLPDVFFSFFSEWPSAIKIAEIFILISLLITFSIVLLHKHNWIVVRRVCMVACLCYFMRSICITLTQVPVPSRNTYCGPVANETSFSLIASRVGWTLSTLGLDIYHKRVLCGDLVFSGHTTTFVLCHLFMQRYAPDNFKWVSMITQFASYCGPVCILLARKHYTLDVVLAIVIASMTFCIYHKIIEEKFHDRQKQDSSQWLSWNALVSFMESDVDEHLENKFRFNIFPSHKLNQHDVC